MNKYVHAIRHGMASLIGWLRLRSVQPQFARDLLRWRWEYFLRRKFTPGLVTPDGFVLETPDTLVTYWSMFVERELDCDDWVNALRTASQPLVLDVGANAGLFSHRAFCLNPRTEIIAFEPLPGMVERINAAKQRNHMNLRCIPKAVGKELGKAMLESPHGYDGTSRISTSGQADSKTAGKTFHVDVTTLDQESNGRSVLIMKVDVEGFEEEVIAGGLDTLSRTKFLIIEAHDAARCDHLAKLLGPGWWHRKLGWHDYLFTRL